MAHEHDFVVGAHLHGAHHVPVAVGDLQRDHALPAAPVLGEIIERRQLAEAVLRGRENVALFRDDQCIDPLIVGQAHAPHARGFAPHRPHLLFGEADRFPGGGEQQYVLRAVGDVDAHQLVTLIERDGDDAAGARPRKQGERGLLDRAEAGRHENESALLKILDGQHRADALALLQRQQIDDGLAAGTAARLRQLIHLEPVHLAVVGEAQQRVVRVGDEQLVDEVLVLDAGGSLAAAAAALRLVIGHGLRLGVAAMRQRDDDVFRRNQIFGGEILVIDENFGAALVAEGVADVFELVADHFEQPLRARQNVRQVPDLHEQFLELLENLVLLEPRQPVEAHLENRLGLRFRELVSAVDDAERHNFPVRARADRARARKHLRHGARFPRPRRQRNPRLGGRRRRLDGRNDVVDVRERYREPLEYVAALARLAQLIYRAARDDLAAMP